VSAQLKARFMLARLCRSFGLFRIAEHVSAVAAARVLARILTLRG
jgi:hypothetical protein